MLRKNFSKTLFKKTVLSEKKAKQKLPSTENLMTLFFVNKIYKIMFFKHLVFLHENQLKLVAK